jgi:hypothetical protein
VTTVTESIARPSGKAYQPRKCVAYPVTDGDYEPVGVLVLGTHDTARAQLLADDWVAFYVDGGCVAVDPVTGWWRDGFGCGGRRWVTDEIRGRAGVWFREIVERSP